MDQDPPIEQKDTSEVENIISESVESDNKAQIALAQAQFAEVLTLSNQLSKESKSHSQKVNELLVQASKLNAEVNTYIVPKK